MQNNNIYKLLIKYYKILYIVNNKKLCITLITVYQLLHPSVYIYMKAEVRLVTNTPPSCAERHEIWEPKPPGTLWGTRACCGTPLPLFIYIYIYIYMEL